MYISCMSFFFFPPSCILFFFFFLGECIWLCSLYFTNGSQFVKYALGTIVQVRLVKHTHMIPEQLCMLIQFLVLFCCGFVVHSLITNMNPASYYVIYYIYKYLSSQTIALIHCTKKDTSDMGMSSFTNDIGRVLKIY